MVDQAECITSIKLGKVTWESFKKKTELEQPNVPIDLTGADLNGLNLSGFDLRGVILTKSKLSSATLTNALLCGVHLEEAVLNGAKLGGANLEGAHLWRAHLDGASLASAKLGGADLKEAKLVNVELAHATFVADAEKAQLAGAILDDAKAVEVVFDGLDLSGASLQGATAKGATFEGAKLNQCKLQGADMSNTKCSGAEFQGADFGPRFPEKVPSERKSAKLQGADLRKAKLKGASLVGTDLVGADLTEADLTNAVLAGADMRHVVLKNTTMVAATGLRGHGAARQEGVKEAATATYAHGVSDEKYSWGNIRKFGALPVFGSTSAGLLFILALAGVIAAINGRITSVNTILKDQHEKAIARAKLAEAQLVEHRAKRPRVSQVGNTGERLGEEARRSKAAADLLSWRLSYLRLPWKTAITLIGVLLLFVASLGFAVWCPPEVKEYTETQWVDELGKPAPAYLGASFEFRPIRVVTSWLYWTGGLMTGVMLLEHVANALETLWPELFALLVMKVVLRILFVALISGFILMARRYRPVA